MDLGIPADACWRSLVFVFSQKATCRIYGSLHHGMAVWNQLILRNVLISGRIN